MNDILFTPIRLSELELLIEKSFERVLLRINDIQQPSKPENNLGDIDWYCQTLHKAKATVYSEISNSRIPRSLIHKPAGQKAVLFYKDKVLDWINNGCLITK